MARDKLDDIDHRIIEILRKDASVSLTSVAKQVGVPDPTVYFRVNRLKKRGVLRFTVLVNDGADDHVRVAFVYPKTYAVSGMSQRVFQDVGAALSNDPRVSFAARMDGKFLVAWRGDFDPATVPNVQKVEPANVSVFKA